MSVKINWPIKPYIWTIGIGANYSIQDSAATEVIGKRLEQVCSTANLSEQLRQQLKALVEAADGTRFWSGASYIEFKNQLTSARELLRKVGE